MKRQFVSSVNDYEVYWKGQPFHMSMWSGFDNSEQEVYLLYRLLNKHLPKITIILNCIRQFVLILVQPVPVTPLFNTIYPVIPAETPEKFGSNQIQRAFNLSGIFELICLLSYGMSSVKTRQRKRKSTMGSPAKAKRVQKPRNPAEVLSQYLKEVASQVPHGQALHLAVNSTETPGESSFELTAG